MTPNSNDAISEQTARYYAARASEYDLSAGYLNQEADQLRLAKKRRYQQLFQGHDVLEIACGTGFWTEVVAETAKSVVATDVNAEMISLAEARCARFQHVACHLADAYALDQLPGTFTAAFAVWWWSHMPKERVREFLLALHRRLVPGALVLFVDQLRYEVSSLRGLATQRHEDSDGNTIEQRVLSDGRSYDIVKNFPVEQELVPSLGDLATNIQYRELPKEKHWELQFRTMRA